MSAVAIAVRNRSNEVLPWLGGRSRNRISLQSMPADEWLRTTIPGIIILGSIGSIAAVGIIRVIGWTLRKGAHLIARVLPERAKAFARGRRRRIHRYEQLHGIDGHDIDKTPIQWVVVYVAFHAARSIVMHSLSGVFIIVFFLHFRSSQAALRSEAYVYAITAFTFFVLGALDTRRLMHLRNHLPSISVTSDDPDSDE